MSQETNDTPEGLGDRRQVGPNIGALREVCLSCKGLLQELSASGDDVQGPRAREQLPRFNVWVANIGIFEPGQRSFEFKLDFMPDIGKTIELLLAALEDDLHSAANFALNPQEIQLALSNETDEIDEDSDRSSTSSYHILPPDEVDDAVPKGPIDGLWVSIQDTIGRLYHILLLIRDAGAQHRKARLEYFLSKESNQEIYDNFKRCAFQKVSFLFPRASDTLLQRMAESIAHRRARFSYLKRHLEKKGQQDGRRPQAQFQAGVPEGSTIVPGISGLTSSSGVVKSVAPSAILSSTDYTRLQPQNSAAEQLTKRPSSVSSAYISLHGFPKPPRLRNESFLCQYCCLTNPAEEASELLWRQHVARDFEPYFCVADNCAEPFKTGASYTGWIAHMRERHAPVQWYCWRCHPQDQGSHSFGSMDDLQQHLSVKHSDLGDDVHNVSLLEQSARPDQQIFCACPFCGGPPEELERLYPDQRSVQACEALQHHIRDHLITLALMMQPLDAAPDDECEMAEENTSKAQGGSANIELLGEEDASPEMHCGRKSIEDLCDCWKTNKDSVTDWRTFKSLFDSVPELGLPQSLLPKSHDDPSYHDDLRKYPEEWEFWRPLSMAGEAISVEYKGHHSNKKLLGGLRKQPGVERMLMALERGSSVDDSQVDDGSPHKELHSIKIETQQEKEEEEIRQEKEDADLGITFEDRVYASLCSVGYGEKRGFLPRSRLAAIVQLNSVMKELTNHFPTLHPSEIRRMALRICNESTSVTTPDKAPSPGEGGFRKIFAILALMNQIEKIILFLEENIHDLELPLIRLREEGGRTVLQRKSQPENTLQVFSKWSQIAIRAFEEWQWCMLAPVFSKGGHYELENQAILPYIDKSKEDDGQFTRKGSFGTVFRVKIHPDHHTFGDGQTHGNVFAVKRLDDDSRERFDREARVLWKLSQERNQHLVELLATYRQFNHWFLIFHWAESDLSHYWEIIQPNPELNKDLAEWVCRQCEGLASGLRHIQLCISNDTLSDGYELYGYARDGYIRPDNILLFRDSGLSDFGALKIAVSSLAENTFLTSDGISGYSGTYGAPEYATKEAGIGEISDIWSMGCIYLEFLSWLLGGFDTMRQFRENRLMFDARIGVNTDCFFEFVSVSRGPHDGNVAAVVKPAVSAWIETLHTHPSCSDKRMTSSRLYEELRIFRERCESDGDYAFMPQPNKGPGRVPHADPVVISIDPLVAASVWRGESDLPNYMDEVASNIEDEELDQNDGDI